MQIETPNLDLYDFQESGKCGKVWRLNMIHFCCLSLFDLVLFFQFTELSFITVSLYAQKVAFLSLCSMFSSK